MNSLLSAEGNSLLPIFQDYELQLYDIRSHILHFYNNIKDRDLSIDGHFVSDWYYIF